MAERPDYSQFDPDDAHADPEFARMLERVFAQADLETPEVVPEAPLGIMYHRGLNPDWEPGAWPKTCPGLQVSHENLDPGLLDIARARFPWPWPDNGGEDPVAEAGTLLPTQGATAREEPSRQGAFVRQLAAGQAVATSGFTDRGEEVAGSARWYRLAEDGSWVHSSGGAYTATP